ncbi:hypothetical protein [Rhizobium ruizarguesonis]|uniref:hypothetical protein n=1 Tax=Rhizobium ruizarguesonis TaxID=2081791 RepID=UPI0013BA50B3|nr:hypothetical protein [Rhizobium ruizarguesonis]NEH64585.1 hypothetical protein [Rhizobium ruizarguesonis]NEH78077.1 hypothetical protein [Rhizobium ruizarguesonis]NEI78508.1 hypothetical protein [Rhizobium ruizarguesonis]
MSTKPDTPAPASEPEISPERAAHLRALNAVNKNYNDVLIGKYLSRTHGDQTRD